MAQFKLPKKKELTPDQEAKLEAFGNQATTSPGTVDKTSLKPEPKQNQTETTPEPAPFVASEAVTEKPKKTKSKASSTGKDDKPGRSFTVPLNDYELDLLRQLAELEDRSQRWIARKTLVSALESALKKR